MEERLVNFLKSESNASKIRRPAFCCFCISSTCVLQCKMCFAWKQKKIPSQEKPMLDQWCRFLGRLYDFCGHSIVMNFSGTEPLCYEENLQLIHFCSKRGLFTSLHTNGVLIDKQMAQKIADSGVDLIIISLDGMKKETHDFLRGLDGCYDKAIRAIDNLESYRNNFKIGIQSIILDRNLDEIIGLAEWAQQDSRINFIAFQAIAQPFYIPFDDEWRTKSEYDFLWPKDIKRVHETIDELIRLKQAGFKISNPTSQFEIFKRYFEYPHDFIKNRTCNVDFYMNIHPNGDIHICDQMEKIGNIKQDEPEESWFSAKADRIRNMMKKCSINCHLLVNCFYEEEENI